MKKPAPEIALEPVLAEMGFHPERSSVYDYIGGERRIALEIVMTLRGRRPLHDFVMRAATMLARDPRSPRTVLVALESGFHGEKLSEVWRGALDALRPEIAERLALVVLGPEVNLHPNDPDLRHLAEGLLSAIHDAEAATKVRREDSRFTVLKVLIHEWLRFKEPSMTKKELGAITGLSQPTIAVAVSSLEEFLRPTSNKRVGLHRFPTAAWRQYTARLPLERTSVSFADTSGEPRTPAALLKRLDKLQLSHVTVSGTIGAHRLDPLFDLEGTPRLDLVVHTPTRLLDLSFIESLDPALKESKPARRPALVVVHALQRAEHWIASNGGDTLPPADAVEVLLDLKEMHLDRQADELIKNLRKVAQ